MRESQVALLTIVSSPYTGPNPFPYSHPPNPIHCAYYTGTDIPPPPSSAPALSVNPPPASSGGVQARDPEPAKCKTVQTTATVEYLCVVTQLVYPPPDIISKTGVLTTRVPDFCAQPPKRSTGQIPEGDIVCPLSYPYFAQTDVECCVYCSEQYKSFVAAGFIPSGLDCQCLINRGTNYPGKSKFCPRGIQPYALGAKKGQALLGACGKAP